LACYDYFGQLEIVSVLEKAYAQIMGEVDVFAITGYTTIRNSHDQLALDHTFQIDVISDFLRCGQNLASEFYFTTTQCATATGIAFPAEEEANQLPHGIQA